MISITTALLIVTLLGTCLAQLEAEEPPSLFLPLADGAAVAAATAAARVPPDITLASLHRASGRQQALVQVMAVDRALLSSSPEALALQLPGVSNRLTVVQRAELSSGASNTAKSAAAASLRQQQQQQQHITWVGEVDGLPGGLSSVVLLQLVPGGAVHGNVRYWDDAAQRFRAFRITPVLQDVAAAGASASLLAIPTMAVEYEEPSAPRKAALPPLEAPLAAGSTADHPTALVAPAAERQADEALQCQQTNENVAHDLLVLYTPSALALLGGAVSSVEAAAQISVEMANKAYADSRIPITLSLMAVRQFDYTESSNSTEMLAMLTSNPLVQLWRNEVGADLVSVFTGLHQSQIKECGRGYVGGGQRFAVSVIAGGCYQGYTLAHEIGHNQGCHHNYNDADAAVYARYIAGPYAWGWRRCTSGDTAFKTIMSHRCVGDSRARNEVGLFSNPSVESRPGSGIPSGDLAQGDCARGIRETACKIAAYRMRKGPSPSPSPSSSPEPAPSPSPSPSPAASPTLALISSLPPGFQGLSGNLSAISEDGSVACSISVLPQLDLDGVTIMDPGPGQCNGNGEVPAGTYRLLQVTPEGLLFKRWDCYSTARGFPAGPAIQVAVTLRAGSAITCVAMYAADGGSPASPSPSPSPDPLPSPSPDESPSPSPDPSPSPSPSPSSSTSPSPSPSPQLPISSTQLALLAHLSAAYPADAASATLNANSTKLRCRKAPAPRLGFKGVSLLHPKSGSCGGFGGTVPEGLYTLQQVPPAGVEFRKWDCYQNTNGTSAGLIPVTVSRSNSTSVTSVMIRSDMVVVCKSLYVTSKQARSDDAESDHRPSR